MFVTQDGQNLLFTFLLVSSLFLLWGFRNGMIDVMDKHFQQKLRPNLVNTATRAGLSMVGFEFVAAYALLWSNLSGNRGVQALKPTCTH